MIFGGITNAATLGSYTLNLHSAAELPQDVASAVGTLFERVGATYTPVYYIGSQLVNGMNHKLVAERVKLVSGGKTIKDFVVVTINIPAGSVGGAGATIVSEDDANTFVLRDNIEKGVKKALAEFTGATIKPIFEIGTQVVKGTNYHFLCENTITYPGAEPYLTRVVFNNFQDNWKIVEIDKLS